METDITLTLLLICMMNEMELHAVKNTLKPSSSLKTIAHVEKCRPLSPI